MRVAIVDMGTNTFNLLVVESEGKNNVKVLHNSKFPVKLGEGGIDKKYITPEAWNRGLAAIDSHVKTIESIKVDKTYAFATSATRDAVNGTEYVNEIYKRHKLSVTVISGDREALLIYKGVRQAVELGNAISLILDIGGGSNELIICNADQVFWKHSFNLGVQRLLEQFRPSDPITTNEILKVEQFLENKLDSLLEASQKFKPTRLVGSSGSFDTYRSLLANTNRIPLTDNCSANIPLNDYLALHQQLLASTREERIVMKGMEPFRVDYIVLASIFTNYIVNRLGLSTIIQSDYALKEGALWEMLYEN